MNRDEFFARESDEQAWVMLGEEEFIALMRRAIAEEQARCESKPDKSSS